MTDHAALIDSFKKMNRDQQITVLENAYRSATEKMSVIIDHMQTLNVCSQHFQDMQRIEGGLLPEHLLVTFRKFQKSSAAMADCWIANNSIMQRSYHFHLINTGTHPHFNQ